MGLTGRDSTVLGPGGAGRRAGPQRSPSCAVRGGRVRTGAGTMGDAVAHPRGTHTARGASIRPPLSPPWSTIEADPRTDAGPT